MSVRPLSVIAFLVVVLLLANANISNAQTEETVNLAFGSLDTNLYGRNFGRDGNTSRLDVTFTPQEGSIETPTQVRISWIPFSISANEMKVYLNDQEVETVASTGNNEFGAPRLITFLNSGPANMVNTVSFRVTGGDNIWGVTNLLASHPVDPSAGDAQTNSILDDSGTYGFTMGNRSQTFSFDFQSRGQFYTEAFSFSFDAFLKNGTQNGFNVRLNGQTILNVPSFVGNGTTRSFGGSINSTLMKSANNSLVISTTSSNSVFNLETTISNIKVNSSSEPLLDLTLSGINAVSGAKRSDPFSAVVTVRNIAAKTSSSASLSFLLSNNANKSNPTTIANATVGAITAQDSSFEVQLIESPTSKNKKYMWACVDHLVDDINAANDCTPAIQLDFGLNPVVAPVNSLLFGS